MAARADRGRRQALRIAATLVGVVAVALAGSFLIRSGDEPESAPDRRAAEAAPAAPSASGVHGTDPSLPATREALAADPGPPAVSASRPADSARGPSGEAVAPAQAASHAHGLRPLSIPVEGVTAADLRDTFDQARGGRRHEAIDIAAPRGTRVVAVDDGTLVKLFTSVPGGLTIYQFDPERRFAYYYAHLDRYADGLREGMPLRRGEVIGYVGFTGNARPDAPHLHFAVFRLGPERKWWKGEPINPFGALH